MLIINVFYTFKPGKREGFLDKVREEGVDTGSRAEDGNFAYRYYRSTENEDELFLYEEWRDADAHAVHRTQPHYIRLQEFQGEYLENTVVNKYFTEE